MNVYKYVAKDEMGKTLKGKVEARDEHQAINILRARQLVVISLTIGSSGPMFGGMLERVSSDDIVQFTQQLSTMMTSGLPLSDALELLKSQSRSVLSKTLGEVQTDIQGGMSLSEALGRHKNVFSPVYLALVKAGEASGKIDTILNRLAENEEKQREFRGKVKGAMIYPVIILIAMVLVMVILMIFVIPQLKDLYSSFGADLPIQTVILMGVSDFVVKFWWIVLTMVVITILIFKEWQKTPSGRLKIDALLLKLPIMGPLRVQTIMAEFTRTLSLLVAAGISILESLGIVGDTVGNRVYQQAIDRISKGVEKGMPLASMVAQQQIFPPLVAQMVAVGEETGKLDEVLGKVAIYFEQNAENKVKNLTTAIEPIIMVVLGVMVAFIVFAIITPLYKLTSLF